MSSVQSIERAFSILEIIAGHVGGIGVSKIASDAGLPKSTVSRLLATLEGIGAVERFPNSTDFRLGAKVISMTFQVPYPRHLTVLARPYLEQLAETTGEGLHLCVPDGDKVRYVDQIKSRHTVQVVRDWTGIALPIHIISAGKLFLSGWDPAVLDEYLTRPLEQFTEKTVTDPEALRQQLLEIHNQGVAWVVDEFEIGMSAVGAPIYDEMERIIAAVIVYGPSYRFPPDGDRQLISSLLISTAKEISERIKRPIEGREFSMMPADHSIPTDSGRQEQ